ncbi:MAG: hypothetical protein PVJ92_01225 [Candidatus Dependentiae bacterium]|jgi:hypothetical protein
MMNKNTFLLLTTTLLAQGICIAGGDVPDKGPDEQIHFMRLAAMHANNGTLPIISSALDSTALHKKTPYILALIALVSYLARRGFNVEGNYRAAQRRLRDATEKLYDFVPAARTKSWYQPLSFVVSDAIEATEDAQEKAAIQDAYSEYNDALSSYRRWRSGSWGSKLGMYGGAAGAAASAAFRAHEKRHGYLPQGG